jgi:hypothetical protein
MATPLAHAMALERRMNVKSLEIKEIGKKIKEVETSINRLLELQEEAGKALISVYDLKATSQEDSVTFALHAIQDVFVKKVREIGKLHMQAEYKLRELLDEEKKLKEQFKIDSAELDRLFNAVCPTTAVHAGIQ